MASSPRVGSVSDDEFVRDGSSAFFFIGNHLTEASPHRRCFAVSDLERKLIPVCSICDRWKKCNLAWREKSL